MTAPFWQASRYAFTLSLLNKKGDRELLMGCPLCCPLRHICIASSIMDFPVPLSPTTMFLFLLSSIVMALKQQRPTMCTF